MQDMLILIVLFASIILNTEKDMKLRSLWLVYSRLSNVTELVRLYVVIFALSVGGLVSAQTTVEKDSAKVTVLENFEVVGYRNQSIALSSRYMGTVSLPHSVIVKTPVIMGESDIIKTLQLEPGVSAGVEGFAGLYVHGGDADENQYTLDRVPLYQVGHLGGLFSAFNTNAIKNVDFYKSTFPARYDGRLSSYVDIYTRDGNPKKIHGSLNLGLISGSLTLEGPIIRDKTTFLLSVRKSWLDIILRPALRYYKNKQYNVGRFIDYDFDYGFMDGTAKIVHRFNSRSKIYLEGYFGYDYAHVAQSEFYEDAMNKYVPNSDNQKTGRTTYRKADLSWGTMMAVAGWDKEFTKSLKSLFSVSVLKYGSNMNNESGNYDNYPNPEKIIDEKGIERMLVDQNSKGRRTNNQIIDIAVKEDLLWKQSDKNIIKIGGSVIRRLFMPYTVDIWKYEMRKNDVNHNVIDLSYKDSTKLQRGVEAHLYFDDEWKINDRWLVSAGVNVSGFKMEKHLTGAVSPRLSFNYRPGEQWAVKGGYTRTSQYVHQLTETLLSLPTDQWLPITATQKPLIADKIAVGGYYSVSPGVTLTVEAYMKWMKNLVDFRDDIYLFPASEQSAKATVTGSGRAKGIDLRLSREIGKLTGHVGYSLLWADRLFAEKNKGKRFPAQFDNRHKINLFLMYEPSKRWDIAVTWLGMTGNRITLPIQGTSIMGGSHIHFYINEGVNNYRLPFYHRMDVSTTLHSRIGDFNLSIYNVYNKLNVVGITVGKKYSEEITESGFPREIRYYQKITLFPIIPSIAYIFKF